MTPLQKDQDQNWRLSQIPGSSARKSAFKLPVGLLLVTGCIAGHSSGFQGPGVCRVVAVHQDTLDLNGDPTYVEPAALETDGGGRLLMLGRLNYRFGRSGEGWRIRENGRHMLGVMLDRTGKATVVAPPIVGKVFDSARAIGANGRWHVLLSELAARGDSTAGDTVAALWYGEFDGAEWSTLRSIPTPDVTLDSNLAASAVGSDDKLAWAFTTRGTPSAVVVIRRSNGLWGSELIRTMAADAEAFFGAGGNLLLATLQSDTTLPMDGSSLLLRSEDRHWNVVSVLHSSTRGQVYRLDVQQVGDTATLTWETRAEGGYRVHTSSIIAGLAGPAVLVDSSVFTAGPLSPVRLAQADRVWVTTHRGPEGAAYIRLSTLAADSSARTLATFPNPFAGGIGVAALGDTLLISGAVANGRKYVASLLLSLEIRCD